VAHDERLEAAAEVVDRQVAPKDDPAMIHKARLVVAAILASLLWSCATAPPCPVCAPCPACPSCPTTVEKPAAGPVTWFVTRVKDGDTLVARMEGGEVERNETIRLLNINTPEKNMPGWAEATEALKALVRGGTISLEFAEPGVEKRDGFGRLLAFVIADGVNVNVEMMRLGWTKLYTKYGKGRLHEEFVAAEKEAREAKRGLWGMEAEGGAQP
jgi:micrococcal nuclease